LKVLKSFWSVVDWQTYLVTFLALTATYICNRFNISAELPSGLIGIAIIFPIVFSINAAYKRREDVLMYFASLKAHGVSLCFAHSHWRGAGMEDKVRAKVLFLSLLSNTREYFISQGSQCVAIREKIYEVFREISMSHEKLRDGGLSPTEVSRANQYLRAMIIEFESMNNVKLYQTPKSLRAYSQIFLNLFPILYAPYFAHICQVSHVLSGYVVAFIYSVVLVTLDNIQEDLEDPFDGEGEDDVELSVQEDFETLL